MAGVGGGWVLKERVDEESLLERELSMTVLTWTTDVNILLFAQCVLFLQKFFSAGELFVWDKVFYFRRHDQTGLLNTLLFVG